MRMDCDVEIQRRDYGFRDQPDQLPSRDQRPGQTVPAQDRPDAILCGLQGDDIVVDPESFTKRPVISERPAPVPPLGPAGLARLKMDERQIGKIRYPCDLVLLKELRTSERHDPVAK